MLVKYGKDKIDVKEPECLARGCFYLGFDKGSFTQGRGYTSYYEKPRPVCGERHLRGCPSNSVCPKCRTSSVDDPGTLCRYSSCKGTLTVSREN